MFVVSSSCFSFFVLLALSRSALLASGFVVCFPLSLKAFRLKTKIQFVQKGLLGIC